MDSDRYEWDSAKERSNFRKHRVHFSDAIAALEDELSLVMFDERTTDEQRMIALGMDVFGRVLVVIFVWKGEKIRLISARKATKRERAQYGVS